MKKPVRQDKEVWDRFYRDLRKLSVQIRMPEKGESVDIDDLMHQFATVQNNRTRLDNILRILERKIGNIRRSIAVHTELSKIVRADAISDTAIQRIKRRDERMAQVEHMVAGYTAKVAALKGKLEDLKAAHNSATLTLSSLETAKQTLNSIRSLAISDRDNNY